MENNKSFGIGDFVSAGTIEDNFLKQGILTKKNDDGTIILRDRSGKEIICKAQGAKKVPDENLSPSVLEEVEVEREKPQIGDFVSAGTVEDNFLKQGIFIKEGLDGTIILRDRSGKEIICKAQGAKKVPDENLTPSTLEEVQNERRNK